MAVTTKRMSVLVVTLGILAFILGVIAENKKPVAGTPIIGKNVVLCKYLRDPTIALGILVYPYKRKSIHGLRCSKTPLSSCFSSLLYSAVRLLPEATKQVAGWKGVEYKVAFPILKPPGASIYPPDMDKMVSTHHKFKKRSLGF